MKKFGSLKLKHVLAAGVAALVVGGVFTAPVVAQQAPPTSLQKDISFTANGISAREAFQLVAKESGLKIQVAPDVTGIVNLSVHHVTAQVALDNLCRQLNAQFAMTDDTILVTSKGQVPGAGFNTRPNGRFIPIDQKPISVSFENADAREALRQVFKATGSSYSIDPMVQGTVTFKGTEVPAEGVLHSILRQINAKFVKEGDVYKVTPAGPTIGSASGWSSEPPVVTQDERFLYLVSSGKIVKVRKSDLKVEKEQAIPLKWGAQPFSHGMGGF